MEKNQYKLCIEVLRKLENVGILKNIIIIGSWCIPFYSEYFDKVKYLPSIKTRDIDFLLPLPLRIKTKIDIAELLKDMGFVIGFKSSQGYIKLEHPELIIEFLVPEKGKGLNKPYPLPELGINAQSLRFLDFLINNTICVKVENISIILPHPANFALHKLIIFQRRRNIEKIVKDRDTAIKILKALIEKREIGIVKKSFNSISQKWRKKIINGLEEMDEVEILAMLK